MNDRVNGSDDNVVPIGKRERTLEDVQTDDYARTSELMTKFSEASMASKEKSGVLPMPALATLLEIQGMQLETLMGMMFSGNPVTAQEFNKVMRLRCKAAIQEIRSRPVILTPS